MATEHVAAVLIIDDDQTLPVIILTAHGTIPDAVEATKRGVYGFIPKPCDQQALLVEVRKALALEASVHAPEAETAIVTASPKMKSLLDEARVVAANDASVLVSGETGTGKELLAQTIHDWSPRRDAPFVPVNCGAIPENLLESELFGHVKGSFTGAVRDHLGLFQSAQGGTIFLDEIGDMPLLLQVKLLRVLQEREVRPVGAARPVKVDVRVISATHRELEAEIAAGRFREDLYYRLNVVNLKLPALGERREDIPLLARHFLASLKGKYRKTITGFAADGLDALARAPWPGNVRQLFNVVEKCVALSTTPLVPLALVERALNRPSEDMASFDEARRAFERNRSDFCALLNRHEIEPESFKD